MLEQLLVWERDAFFMLNGSDSAFLDRFMWIYSGKAVWLPLAFFILVVLCYKKNWKEWLLILLAIVLTITLCDQFASHVCKPIFTRFRPTHHPDFMDQVKVVFGYRGGMYGFISSHAADASSPAARRRKSSAAKRCGRCSKSRRISPVTRRTTALTSFP